MSVDVEKIINALGGVSATARIFEINRSSVSEWKKKKKIPKARLMYVEVAYPKLFLAATTPVTELKVDK